MPCSAEERIFEVKHKDLLGRIGRLITPRKTIETPALLPVVNPSKLIITPRELYEEYGVHAIMTNAYLLKKFFSKETVEKGIHRLLRFDGVIATDSGAYQILKYGAIDVEQNEIIEFQEAIRSDIGVILDIPTGSDVKIDQAKLTVEETIRRADEAVGLRRRKDMIWVGPIQGGVHLDLLRFSAREMSRRAYPILALGSPTVVMERYQYGTLVDMIMTTKRNIPPSRPLHLFGAGHPSMMSFAVALGCDLFDSAAYALFAYEGRYMTEDRTLKLEDLEYLPCSCPTCMKLSARELRSMEPEERIRSIASHNLWITMSEIKRIKQAICEGRIWELLERRARAHPALQEALLALRKYGDFLERHSPSNKPHGIFYFGRESIARPETTRFRRLLRRYFKGLTKSGIVMLVTFPWGRLSNQLMKRANMAARKHCDQDLKNVATVVFMPPLGPVPVELLEVYPAGKITMPLELDEETLDDTTKFTAAILASNRCTIVTISDGSAQSKAMLKREAWSQVEMTTNLFKENV